MEFSNQNHQENHPEISDSLELNEIVAASIQIYLNTKIQEWLLQGLTYEQIAQKLSEILENTQNKDYIIERIRIQLMVGIQYLLES